MPTGYTQPIEDNISFEEFVWNCARAFGALYHLRDSPNAKISIVVKQSNYHSDELKKAKLKLLKIEKMSIKDCEKQSLKEYRQEVIDNEKYFNSKKELKSKYLKMLEKVKNWNPPTPEHFDLKAFMIRQIEESINFDCENIHLPEVVQKTGKEWKEEKIQRLRRDIEYHREHFEEEILNAQKKSIWLSELAKSVGPPPK